jgi:hypothetical protein
MSDIKVKVLYDDSQVQSGIKGTERTIDQSSQKMATSLKLVATGFVGIAVAKFAKDAIKLKGEMERLTTQFVPLLGGIDQAKKRLADLSDFASKTPFQLPELANASRVLETLTKGALSTGEGLRLVGDASAQSGVQIEELAVTVGRAYSALSSNRGAGESLARMQELGILTGDARNEIERLQTQMKGKEAWEVLQGELAKASGGMENLSQTFEGKLSTLSDNWDEFLRNMVTSDSFIGMKSAVDSLITSLNLINEAISLGGIEERNAKIKQLNDSQMQLLKTHQDMALQLEFYDGKLNVSEDTLNSYTQKQEESRDAWIKNQRELIKLGQATNELTSEYRLLGVTLEDVEEKKSKLNKTSGDSAKSNENEWLAIEKQVSEELRLMRETEDESEKARIERQNEFKTNALKEQLAVEKAIRDESIEAQRLIFQQGEEQTKRDAEQGKRNAQATKENYDAQKKAQQNYLSASIALQQGFFKKNKPLAIANATIAGGVAVMNALETKPFLPLGLSMAVLAGEQTASQINTISKASYKDGGIIEGNSFNGDSRQVMINSGEMVLNRSTQAKLFDKLNSGGGGGGSVTINIQGNADKNTVNDLQKLADRFKDMINYGYLNKGMLA